MTTTEAIRLQLRSWPEVEAYLERCKGVIVPLGSTEQHGPTGAIGTDALTAEAVALEVGRRSSSIGSCWIDTTQAAIPRKLASSDQAGALGRSSG